MRGDLDGNGRITAGDARTALRASAKLAELDALTFDAANADTKATLSAGAA